MAGNKECLIIVLDVRHSANDNFKLKSIKCVAEILKDKICSGKKDYVSFVLVGCDRTENDLNNDCHDSYEHIVQYTQAQLPTWQLLMNFFKFVNETPGDEGDWLDGIVVAMDMLQKTQEIFKCARSRILLFYDFNWLRNNYDSFDVITEQITKCNIGLIVASHNIAYIDNVETGAPQAVFENPSKIDHDELENQKYASRLVSNCNATLCNFKEALDVVFKVQSTRPWVWNSTLTIGSKISINISGIIAMKDESNIKLKKCWGEENATVTRDWKYYLKGGQISVLPDDLIDGYMMGGTPIAFDYDTLMDDDDDNNRLFKTPGLKFIGFVKANAIPDEYYCGDSLYMVLHQKGMPQSARKFDALVKALINTDRKMLCWKIFSAKFNQPKLVVLFPNELADDKPASLLMLELSYHAQHHFWDFPSLRTEKSACSAEQFKAIDNLIDSMDLELTLKDTQQPRDTRQNDLLPYDQLPHIYEQNVMDVLERRVICNASEDDEEFKKMLEDKNFVEIFWKVPEPIEEKAKQATNVLKKLFPLEKNTAWLEKSKSKDKPLIKQEKNNNSESSTSAKPLDFDRVRLTTPAEDFEQLLTANVETLQNNTLRDAKFDFYSIQMREAIENLIKSEETLEFEKLLKAMKIYRKRCCDFKAFADYNKWIRQIKVLAVDRDMRDFWRNVIVEHNLGICVVGEPSLEDEIHIDDFYTVQSWKP